MPADLTISSIGNRSAEPPPAPPREVSSGPSPASTVAAPGPNPVRYFDTASGIVVLEFVSANGSVANTIPTEKQLQAFRHSHEQAASPVQSIPPGLSASLPAIGESNASQAAVPAATTPAVAAPTVTVSAGTVPTATTTAVAAVPVTQVQSTVKI